MATNEELQLITERIKYLRDILDLSQTEMAEKAGLSLADYQNYESGKCELPISAIYAIAAAMNVDATELLTGEAPRMKDYTVTRKGQGIDVERYEGYAFEALAHNFVGRDKEPMLVTLAPSEEKAKLVTHSGQEFNYVLEGKVGVVIGAKTLILEAGDSIYFDPRIPHGQFAVDAEAKFLTIIDK